MPLVMYLIYVDVSFGGSFDIRYVPLCGFGVRFLLTDFPVSLQVAFVANQQERNVLVILHSQNLLSAGGGKEETDKEKGKK